MESEGILAQIRRNSKPTQSKLTLKTIKETFEEMFNAPMPNPVLEISMYYALGLPDKAFIHFMGLKANIKLTGGMDAYTKLQERIKLLNIKQ